MLVSVRQNTPALVDFSRPSALATVGSAGFPYVAVACRLCGYWQSGIRIRNCSRLCLYCGTKVARFG